MKGSFPRFRCRSGLGWKLHFACSPFLPVRFLLKGKLPFSVTFVTGGIFVLRFVRRIVEGLQAVVVVVAGSVFAGMLFSLSLFLRLFGERRRRVVPVATGGCFGRLQDAEC